MEISKEQVLHIAKLSALKLNDDEVVKYGRDLSNVISYMDKLNALNTSAAEAAEHAMSVPLKMRKDEIIQPIDRDEMVKNAPKSEDGFFVVPKVVG
ncbi:MAG: Asp-tRNA(Asn)/Glu-tRNA(Gln) amidotransferase subunit GatC [Fibrobacteres bacterium]|nr:Asp-tRNA(Asn)/Glu-tRNA(Gln) amidotransferase subunit GatC [Fibrobacterota bacterium]